MPFKGTSSNPFANPNPAYFKRADDMIKLATAHGITVFLDPAETGGWLSEIDQAGVRNDFNYGIYLGRRYKNFRNTLSGLVAMISRPGETLLMTPMSEP